MKTILNIRRNSTTLAAAVVGLLLSAALAGAGPALHHASGGGHFFAKTGGGGTNEFMLAFNARQLNEEGTAGGQLEFHNLTNGTSLHLMIVHLEFLGEATVGVHGVVTKSVGANAEVGRCRAVKVQDNGEGKNGGVDMTSKLSSKCPGADGFSWDNLKLITLDNGNIRVR